MGDFTWIEYDVGLVGNFTWIEYDVVGNFTDQKTKQSYHQDSEDSEYVLTAGNSPQEK